MYAVRDGLIAAFLMIGSCLPEAQAGGANTGSVEDQVKMGAVDYESFCAACHGKDARGNGPVAMELKTAPPSLRNLAARRNGIFDVNEIVKIIDGRDMPRAHGTPRCRSGEVSFGSWLRHRVS
jgi:hypothetical protein